MTSENREDETIPQSDFELERAVDAFVTAKEAGDEPNIERFVERYPRIADRLRVCLSGLEAADAAVHDLEAQLPDSIPRQLGDFRVLAEIGRGGMGEVYRAEQVSLNRPVALKVLPRNWGWTPSARKRFHREAQAAAKLHHTNIVAVYAEGEQHGVCYYAMELIDGPSLDQIVATLRGSTGVTVGELHDNSSTTAPFDSNFGSPAGAGSDSAMRDEAVKNVADSSGIGKSSRDRFDTIAKWISSVADALHYAHEQGVIHRDVKPSNLMLGQDGRVRLTDFGLARLAEQPGMTMTGEMLGTPRYMSPEQVAAGRIEVDARTDVYSLGATLYELLTLRPPFPGTARDQIIGQVISTDPKRPRRVDASIPVDLETICLKAMEKDVSRRYQSAGEFAADLRRYVDRYAIKAKRTGPLGRLQKWAKRHPTVAALSMCLLLSAVGVGYFGWKYQMRTRQITEERRQTAIDRALTEVMSGNPDGAMEAAREAELLGAEPGWVRLLEGLVALARGELTDAQMYFEQAIRLMPDSVAAHALLGRAFVYLGTYEAGTAIQERIDSLPPKSALDLLFLAYHQEVYAPKKAVETIDALIEQRDSIVARSNVARKIRAGALSNLAQLEGDPSIAERAVIDAEAAYAMLSNDDQLALAKCIEAHTAAANAYHLQGDEKRRQQHLVEASEFVASANHEQASDQVLCHVAYYWDRKGDHKEAFEAWRRASNAGWPRSTKVYVCELFRRREFQEALNVLNSLGEKTKNTNLAPLKALMLAELGKPHQASAELQRLKLQADMKVEIKVYVATIAEILGHRELATELFDIDKSALPDKPYIPKYVIEFHAGKKSVEEVLETAMREDDRLAKWEARFHVAHYQLGRLAPGDREKALEHFRAFEGLNQYYHYEYRWARAFRERLSEDPDWPASIRIDQR